MKDLQLPQKIQVVARSMGGAGGDNTHLPREALRVYAHTKISFDSANFRVSGLVYISVDPKDTQSSMYVNVILMDGLDFSRTIRAVQIQARFSVMY